MIGNTKIIAGPKSWIEGAAVAQLEKTSKRRDVDFGWGMADLHPGPGHPIGAVWSVINRVYPDLIGSDIGCGMAWWRLSNSLRRPERIAKKIKSMERGVDEPEQWLQDSDVEPCGHEHSLGTVGRGNHFAEFLIPDGILDPEAYARITDDAPALLLVHSGSRGFGEQILYAHTAIHQDNGLEAGTDEFKQYLTAHDHAVRWAEVNRRAIAGRLFDMTGLEGTFISDVVHNFVEGQVSSMTVTANEAARYDDRVPASMISNVKTRWIHRKGAIPANRGPVIIPGSRDAHSYLVEPLSQESIEASGYSLSHGAGRKMSRRDARVKFNAIRDSIKKLQHTRFNSIVICEDRELLMEEAGETYKAIDRVIQDQVDHDLLRVVAMLKPAITYKFRPMAGAHAQHSHDTVC